METTDLKKQVETCTLSTAKNDSMSKLDRNIFHGMNITNFKHCIDQVLEAINNPPFHFLIIGQTGTGKTYFAKRIMNEYLNSVDKWTKSEKWFMPARKVYDRYKSLIGNTYASDKGDAIEKCQRSALGGKNDAWCAVLDDIGTEKGDAGHNFIAGLIESRYESIIDGHSGSTIITTNLGLESGEHNILKLYGERVSSRIMELFSIIVFSEIDFRRPKAKIWQPKSEKAEG